MKKTLIAACAMTAVMNLATAQVSVTAPWIRATVPAQKSTGAFLYLQAARDARLVGVSSPVAATVELHHSEMRGDMMQMRHIDGIDLAAGRGVNLAAGGYHIMLMGLKRQLKDGDVVPMTLVVEHKGKSDKDKGKRESITVRMPVKPLGFVSPSAAPAAMGH